MNPSPTPTLEDIRPIAPPENYFQHHFWFWLSLFLGLCVIGFFLWQYWKHYSTKNIPIPLSPREKAFEELNALESKIDHLDPRQFGNQVCDILRLYLVKQYHLLADKQTSPEFIAYIHRTKCFSETKQHLLTNFLEQCDLLKFARHQASQGAKKEFIDCAREFVSQEESASPVDEVTPNTVL